MRIGWFCSLFVGKKWRSQVLNILIKLELEFFLIYNLQLKLYSLHFIHFIQKVLLYSQSYFFSYFDCSYLRRAIFSYQGIMRQVIIMVYFGFSYTSVFLLFQKRISDLLNLFGSEKRDDYASAVQAVLLLAVQWCQIHQVRLQLLQ